MMGSAHPMAPPPISEPLSLTERRWRPLRRHPTPTSHSSMSPANTAQGPQWRFQPPSPYRCERSPIGLLSGSGIRGRRYFDPRTRVRLSEIGRPKRLWLDGFPARWLMHTPPTKASEKPSDCADGRERGRQYHRKGDAELARRRLRLSAKEAKGRWAGPTSTCTKCSVGPHYHNLTGAAHPQVIIPPRQKPKRILDITAEYPRPSLDVKHRPLVAIGP